MIFKLKNYLLILTTLFALNFKVYSEDCLGLANRIIKSDRDGKVLESDIPKKLRLNFSPDENAVLELHKDAATDIFNQSRKSFEKIIKKKNDEGDDLADILKALRKGDLVSDLKESEKEKDELIENLKAIRKKAIILRSIFEVYSKDHQSPEQFEKFTKSLGKLNDYLDFDAWKATPDGAKKVAKAFDMDLITEEFDAFVASSPKATKIQLEEIKAHILILVNKKNLTVDEFHETRKLLKHFLAVTQLNSDRQELETSFKFLEELNDKLGSLRDDVLKHEVKAKNKGKKIEDEGFQNIPENFKEAIRTFVANFKIVLD